MQIKLDDICDVLVDEDVLCKHYGAPDKTIMLLKIYVLLYWFIYSTCIL